MSVEMKDMHDDRSVVSNLIKFSRPPPPGTLRDDMRPFEELLFNAVGLLSLFERARGPRIPFGRAGESGGDGVRAGREVGVVLGALVK